MVLINKGILHILDINSDGLLLSETELSLQEDTIDFLQKHLEKILKSQDAKTGTFYDDSEFQRKLNDYIAEKTSFLTFSHDITKLFNGINVHVKNNKTSDFIILDVLIDNKRKIILMKAANHQGFMHQAVTVENGIQNEIVSQWSIMPSISQRMDEFAIIDVESKELRVAAKRYEIDGNMVYVFSEMFLECSLLPSTREAIKTIRETAKKVAEDFGQNEIKTMAAVKTAISLEAENSASLNPHNAGKKIFADNPAMQKEYEEKINKKGFDKPIPVNKEATMKKMYNHKLQTDTGIELSIPVNYLENTEFVEFNHNTDGSLSITLKHITNIINRA